MIPLEAPTTRGRAAPSPGLRELVAGERGAELGRGPRRASGPGSPSGVAIFDRGRAPSSTTGSGSCSGRSRCCDPTRSPPAAPRSMASAGTAIGFALSAACSRSSASITPRLWIIVVVGVLPVRLHAAGRRLRRRAGVLHDRGGRMFNLIEPQGWHTGLVRFENIVHRVVGERRRRVAVLAPARIGRAAGERLELYRASRARCRSGSSTRPIGRTGAPRRAARPRVVRPVPVGDGPASRRVGDRGPRCSPTLRRSDSRSRRSSATAGVTRFERCGPTRSAFREVLTEVDGRARRHRRRHCKIPSGRDGAPADVAATRVATRAPVSSCLEQHAHEAGPDGALAAGLDAALVRDLLVEVAALADAALVAVPKVPAG